MKQLSLLVMLLLAILLLPGQTSAADPKLKDVTVYYYFLPTCPNCIAVKPYTTMLFEEIKSQGASVIIYDLSKKDALTPSDIEQAKKVQSLMGKDKGFAVPTAAVLVDGQYKIFVGRDQMLLLGDYLHDKFAVNKPRVGLANKKMEAEECYRCHEAKKLPPPSKLQCTTCCHTIN